MQELIKVEALSKTYKLYSQPVHRLKESLSLTKKKYHTDHHALSDINFNVYKGETVGIIGKNGSGKSTLLKIITGVLNPTSGSVVVNGKIAALLELGAGFNPEYTGIENIYLNGTMMGFSRDVVQSKLEDIIKFADIGQFIYQPVKTYSSGMFARLAFSVAINVDPDILIVDEALSVGDIFFQNKCYKKFEEFTKKGKTILFVSHDMGSIIKYCSRAIVINEGKMLNEGPSKEMVDVYKKVLSKVATPENESESVIQEVIASGHEEDSNWIDIIDNKNPSSIDYGNGKATIFDCGLFDDTGKNLISNVMKNEIFHIKMKVKFNVDVEDPIFAFTIKDVKGTEITGTNTLYESVATNYARQGSTYEIEFTQKLPLHSGDYLISLGCTGFQEGEFEVYHRLYDIMHLGVTSEKNTVGFFDTESRVKVKVYESSV